MTLGPPTAAAIVHWLKLTVAPGTVTELRILRARNDPRFATFTVAGYFDSDHLAELAEAAMEWTGKSEGCYVSLNPVLPDLLSRAANRVITRPPRTTSDAEIVRRAGLVFDADPVRPAGVSATDIEKAAAKERIGQVLAELTRRGWPPAIMGDSGNGFHLRYRIHLPVDDGGLIETVLEAADAAFSDHRVTIDPALFNPSRIVKLFGTMSRKGDSTADRPHRRSTVLSVPTDYQVVPTALLEAFVEEFKSEVPGLNGRARPAPRPSIASERKPTGDLKPGEDFESQASWESILEPHGWTVDSRHGDEIRWTRPGKDDGPSATTGHNAGLHVFTSSAPPFEANGNYSKFAAYTLLNHGGDYQSASRDLAARGFGGQKPPTRSAGVNGKASAAATYKGAAKVAPTPFARVTCAMLIEAQPVEWLWELRVPLGVLTMFAGDPKLGKSFATLNVAAAVSRGWPLPGEDAARKPGSVLIMSAEDDPARTIVPRLKAAGADLSRIHILDSIILPGRDAEHGEAAVPAIERLPSLVEDIGKIENAVAALADCRLIIIDPVSAYLGATDDHKNAEIRGVLSPLKAVAETRNCAVILVSHLTKAGGVNGKMRVQGSIAYVAAARANFLFMRDKDNPAKVLMLDNGCNLAPGQPGLAFTISDRGEGPHVEWFPTPIDKDADTVLREIQEAQAKAAADTRDPTRSATRKECEAWLRNTLESHSVSATEIHKLGRAAGYSKDQVDRAKQRIGATSHRVGFGPAAVYWWTLQTTSTQ